MPFRLIKYDVENDAHIRTADGFCIECPVGEVGEGIGRIDNDPNKMTGNSSLISLHSDGTCDR